MFLKASLITWLENEEDVCLSPVGTPKTYTFIHFKLDLKENLETDIKRYNNKPDRYIYVAEVCRIKKDLKTVV